MESKAVHSFCSTIYGCRGGLGVTSGHKAQGIEALRWRDGEEGGLKFPQTMLGNLEMKKRPSFYQSS